VFKQRPNGHRTDIVVIPADGYDLKAGFTDKDKVFATGPRNGMHKFENACLFSTSPDLDLTEADLFDITPTILDLLDIDVAEGVRWRHPPCIAGRTRSWTVDALFTAEFGQNPSDRGKYYHCV